VGGKRSVVAYATKTTPSARSHDLFPGLSGAKEKHFPLIKKRNNKQIGIWGRMSHGRALHR